MSRFNRRRFLVASTAACGILRAHSRGSANEPSKMVPPPVHDPPVHDSTFSSVAPDHLAVALMGDPQLHMNPKSLEHVKAAMDDWASLPHDFLVVLGDLVQNKPEYFADYERLILRRSTKPLYSIAGNAEIGAGLDAYQKATKLPLYYKIYRRGIRFIFTSVTAVTGKAKHICELGDKQLAWLRNELAADTKATTLIAFHAPVLETTWHSEDRAAQPFPGSMYLKESTQMRSLFAKYPNIKLYVHGHLHHRYGLQDKSGRGEYCLEKGVLHVSVGATANNQGGILLLIGTDKIVARVRDHSNRRWRDDYSFTLHAKTSLEKRKQGAFPPSNSTPGFHSSGPSGRTRQSRRLGGTG